MSNIITTINNIVWSTPLIVLCLAAGAWFSIRLAFPQFRHFVTMIKLLFGGEKSTDGVTPFQAFATTVGGRVGVGNIAGVATALYFGGPGAIFWMWVLALLGAASAFVESALGQAYKTRVGGEYVGGPAYFIERGLGQRWYGVIFAFCTILAPGILMPGAQTYTITSSMESAFGINQYVMAVILCVAVGLVIFGGVKRIGRVAEIIAPVMSVAFILVALVITVMNITKVPSMIALIFKSAFGAESMFAGIIGSAIAWGVKRGVYSNEAGQGSGAIVSSAAECSHPAKQGLIQAFSIYVDTIVVCTATAFMLLLTGAYNVIDGAGAIISEGIPGVEYGILWAQEAVNRDLQGFGGMFIAVSVFLFAYTSLLSYYYQAESNVTYIFKENKTAKLVLRIIFICAVFYGVLNTGSMIWTCGDLGVGLMAWLNIIAILLLSKKAVILLKDFEEQKKRGVDPMFDPAILGIDDKEHIWDSYKAQKK
ncbi:MAG: alanine/glycine:cation symporter family protein [Oscillospiraceae bacterium]